MDSAKSPAYCPLCDSFAAPNLKGVVRHIGVVHAHEPGFRVTCGVDGCTKSYRKFVSYKKHMYVKHRDAQGAGSSERGALVQDSEAVSSVTSISEEDDQESYMNQLRRSTALFILKARREIHKIPQTSLDYLLGDISTFMDMNRSRLLQKISVALKEKGIDMESDLVALSTSPDITNPFEGLHTEYLQKQFFLKYFNLVVSVYIHMYIHMYTCSIGECSQLMYLYTGTN